MGREKRTFADPGLRKTFLNACRGGVPVEFAAALCRVSTKTVYDTKERGLIAGKGADYEFALEYMTVPGQRIQALLGTIHAAAKTDWTASRYLLACGFSSHFSEAAIENSADLERELKQVRVGIESDPEVIADEKRKRKALADQAENAARVSAALAQAAKDGKIGHVVGLDAFLNAEGFPADLKAGLLAWMAQTKTTAIVPRDLGAEPVAGQEGKA